MNRNIPKRLAALCRWTARIVGTFLVLIMVTIAVGQGLPNPFTQPVPVQLGFLGLALIMAGILGGWRWDLAPAIVSLAGWCLFLFVAVKSPRGPNSFIIALALPAVLLLASAHLNSRSQRQSPP
jgi:hypothetical protein